MPTNVSIRSYNLNQVIQTHTQTRFYALTSHSQIQLNIIEKKPLIQVKIPTIFGN